MTNLTFDRNISFFDKVYVKINEAKKAGLEIYDFSIGDPDLPPPAEFGGWLKEAVSREGAFAYPSQYGEDIFLESISYWFEKKYGLALNPDDHFLPLLGVKEGVFHLALGLLNQGDYGAFVTPAYPIYNQAILAAGGIPNPITSFPEDNYVPTLSKIPSKIRNKLKLLYLNYPQNPTGAVLTETEKKNLVEFSVEHGINTCWDVSYSRISPDGQYDHDTIFKIPGALENCLEMYSFSKDFNLPGLRLGFAVGSKNLIDQLKKVKTNVDVCAFKAIQYAASKLLRLDAESGIDQFFRHNNHCYLNRMNKVKYVLNKHQVKFFDGKGTFFLWLQAPSFMNDAEFCDILFETQRLLLVPGDEFGDKSGKWCRMTISKPDYLIDISTQLLDSFLEGVKVKWHM